MERGLDHFTRPGRSLQADARGLKAGEAIGFYLSSQSDRGLLSHRRSPARRGTGLFGLFPLPGRDGCFHSHQRDGLLYRRHGLRVPFHRAHCRHLIVKTPAEFASLVQSHLTRLRKGGMSPSIGDIRCVAYGHLIRMAIWELRRDWQVDRSIGEKLDRIAQAVKSFGGWEAAEGYLHGDLQTAPKLQLGWLKRRKHHLGESRMRYPFEVTYAELERDLASSTSSFLAWNRSSWLCPIMRP